MVHQVLADARKLGDHLNPLVPQMPRGADAVPHPKCWRMQRACGDQGPSDGGTVCVHQSLSPNLPVSKICLHVLEQERFPV